VARDEPGRLDAKATEQLQQARTADLSGKKTARNIVGGILAAIGAEPSGDGVDINAKTAQDLPRHCPSPALAHLLVLTIRAAIGRMFAQQATVRLMQAQSLGSVFVGQRLAAAPKRTCARPGSKRLYRLF
jgi:hypothetical protein